MCSSDLLNVNLLIDKEVTLKTVFRYQNVYPKAITAVATGTIPLGRVVSAIYPFEDIQQGMEHAIHHKADVTKCVIRVTAEG